MKLFAALKTVREFERSQLTFIRYLVDLDIIIEIGYAQEPTCDLRQVCDEALDVVAAANPQQKFVPRCPAICIFAPTF